MSKVIDVSSKFQSRSKTCPTCREKATSMFSPFCSKRCKDIDLGRWMTGSYYIAGVPDAESRTVANDDAG